MSKTTKDAIVMLLLGTSWLIPWAGGYTSGERSGREITAKVEEATGIPGVLNKNLCSLRESVYLDAYLKGRKAQRRIDVRAFEEECIKKIEKRKCAPLHKYKETKMSDEKKTKRRGRKKKSTVTSGEPADSGVEPAAIDLPSDTPVEVAADVAVVAEAPVAEAPVAEAPVAEAPVAEAPVAEAPAPAAKPALRTLKSTDKFAEEDEAYPLGAQFWFNRHANIGGILVPPGTAYEVVASAPEGYPVVGAGSVAPAHFCRLRGTGPEYFTVIGRHTAITKL